MFELIKRGNSTVAIAGDTDDVKARYPEDSTVPEAGQVVLTVQPMAAWEWDPNSTADDGDSAIEIGASETGRFVLTATSFSAWAATIDVSGEQDGNVLAIDDGAIVAQPAGTPGPHDHDLDDINQPASLSAFNTWLGATLDTTSDTRDPKSHSHSLSDVTSPANIAALNNWAGVTLDTASDTRDPKAHTHGLSDITQPANLAAFNSWIGVTLDTSSDTRTPTSHTHPISDINTFNLTQINARLTGGNLDLAGDERPPADHSHDLDDVEGPDGLTALNNWADTNLDNADDPRPPTSHTHPIGQINTFNLTQLNNRLTSGNLDLAGAERPPTSHTHPISELTAAGESNNTVLRVSGGSVVAQQIMSNTAPSFSGGAPAAGVATTVSRADHKHDIGAFDPDGITVQSGVCPIGSAEGFACLIQGTSQTITSFGTVPGSGCFRLAFSYGNFTIDASASGISVPGGEDITVPIEGKILLQGIPATDVWFVVGAWNAAGESLVGLRKGSPNGARVGGNPSVSPGSNVWAPDNHTHDIGSLGSNITVNSTGILLAPNQGDVVTLTPGSSSSVLNFGSNTGQRRVCMVAGNLTFSAGFGLGFPSSMLSSWNAKNGDVFIAQGVGGSNWYVIPLKYLPLIEGEGTMQVVAEPGGALNPVSSSQAATDFYLVNDRVTHSSTSWQSVVIPTSKHGKTISGGIMLLEAALFVKPTSGSANITNAGYMMRRGIWFAGSTGSGSLRITELVPPINIGSINVTYSGERLVDETPKIWMELIPAGVTGPDSTINATNLRMFYQLNTSTSREVLRTVKVTGIQ